MPTTPQSVAHPLAKEVPLRGGALFVTVLPFNMVVARQARPALVDILTAVADSKMNIDLVQIVDQHESSVMAICQSAVTLPEGVTWETLDYEDFLNIVQAIWETSILRPDGGGLLGKIVNLAVRAKQVREQQSSQLSETRSGSDSEPSTQPPSIEPSSQNGASKI